ncbi:PEP-CTERM-box response regulator transcription factor [Salinibius halmophilus]|uniref:PEP-CTERM-box response regulator transcription factor n=1 Tax=Salinibius halmophilus TaxID=1853216 RepID=UPI000E6650F9|nr:PEP-CTERM-box response regulator transcription factor [Salinibius halmophilus]
MDRTILIIEDDDGVRSQLKWHFDDFDTTILTESDREAALIAVQRHQPAVVIQDLGLPPDPEGVSEGLRCISDILTMAPYCQIIVLTGRGDKESAKMAIGNGAVDFLAKPVEPEQLDQLVARAFRVAQIERDRILPTASNPDSFGIVSNDPDLLAICQKVAKLAPSDLTCTFIGESGTGKELFANLLHKKSAVSTGPFIEVNCATITDSLAESVLFGHEKGSFTGAHKKQLGKIASANGGTLFLDEIGDLPEPQQAKLLRFLQEGTIEPVGATKPVAVDVRVVCATNKDLRQMVAEGSFREDLYHRICAIELHIPPLRARQGDKLLLAENFRQELATGPYAKVTGFSEDAKAAIENFDWPGNVRQLKNTINRAVIMADGKLITVNDLGLPEFERKVPATNTDQTASLDIPDSQNFDLKAIRDQAELSTIERALEHCKYNMSAAAKLLGVSRPTLYDLIKKHGIQQPN